VDKFFQQSDPERENLCLYGHQDGSWEVDLPAEEVPPELPEPALGINFARDGMQARIRYSRTLRRACGGLSGLDHPPRGFQALRV
jgi:hypothetical protein